MTFCVEKNKNKSFRLSLLALFVIGIEIEGGGRE
jgi:hypothetical protein